MIGNHTLIDFAKSQPAEREMLRKMLEVWLKDTEVNRDLDHSSIDFVRAAIRHSKMKYRLGFLTKEEVLSELKVHGAVLASDPHRTQALEDHFQEIVRSIENNTFEVVVPLEKA